MKKKGKKDFSMYMFDAYPFNNGQRLYDPKLPQIFAW